MEAAGGVNPETNPNPVDNIAKHVQVGHLKGQEPTIVRRLVAAIAFIVTTVLSVLIAPVGIYRVACHFANKSFMNSVFSGSKLNDDSEVTIGDTTAKVGDLKAKLEATSEKVNFMTSGGNLLNAYIVRSGSTDKTHQGKWTIALPPAGHTAESYGDELATKLGHTNTNILIVKLPENLTASKLRDTITSSFLYLAKEDGEEAKANNIALYSEGVMATATAPALKDVQAHFSKLEMTKDEADRREISVRSYSIDAPTSLKASQDLTGFKGTAKSIFQALFTQRGNFNLARDLASAGGIHAASYVEGNKNALGAQLDAAFEKEVKTADDKLKSELDATDKHLAALINEPKEEDAAEIVSTKEKVEVLLDQSIALKSKMQQERVIQTHMHPAGEDSNVRQLADAKGMKNMLQMKDGAGFDAKAPLYWLGRAVYSTGTYLADLFTTPKKSNPKENGQNV